MSEDHQSAATGWHVPPWVHIPRLETLLGRPLGELTWTDITELESRAIAEDLTLEFKSELYKRSDEGRKELAKDVAAMANASGGLLIIGVFEDVSGRASGVSKVALLDDQRNRMRQILSTNVAPLMPDLQLGELRDPEDPDHGVFLILVPASDAAPHGVQYNERFLWPVREDRTIRSMHEPELASHYRERFAGADRQAVRLEQVDREGIGHIWKAEGWLAISLVPGRMGRLTADKENYREWLRKHFEAVPWSLAVDAGVALGRRRVIFTDQYQFSGHSKDHHLELHSDGSGFAAIALSARALRPDNADYLDLPDNTCYFHVDKIAVWTLGLVDVLANHAVRTGGGGDLSLRAQLLAGDSDLSPAPRSARGVRPIAISEGERGDMEMGVRVVPSSRQLTDTTSLDITVPASVVTSPRDLVAAAAEIAHELAVEFNAPPTRPLLSTEPGCTGG